MKRTFGGINLELAGTKDFWRPDFFALMAIVNLLFTLVLDNQPNADKFWKVIVSRLLVTCANICIAWLLSTWFYKKSKTIRAGFIFNLAVVELTVVFGNAAMIFMLQALGISHSVNPANRMFATAFIGPVFFFAAVYVLGDSYKKGKLRLRVLNLVHQIKYLEIHTDEVVSNERLRLLDQVSVALTPKIQYAKNLIGGIQSTDAVNVLRFLNQSEVRPLASAISRQIDTQPETDTLDKPHRTASPQAFNVADSLLPWAFLTLEVIAYVALCAMARQLPDFHVLASLLGSFLILVLVRRAMRFAPPRLSHLRLLPILAVLGLVLAITLSTSLGIDSVFHSDEIIFSFSSLVGTVTISFAFSAAMAMTSQQANLLLVQLQDLEQNLNLQVCRLKQKQWVSRQAVISQVHGQVQGAVVAALTRLGQTEDPNRVEKAKEDLDRALNSLHYQPAENTQIGDSLNDLKLSWAGVCQIELELDPEAESSCNLSATTAFVVNALVTEGIVNAVRHGHAKKLEVCLETLSPGLLNLRMTDDGLLDAKSKPGNGSKLLSDLSSSWTLKKIEGKTVLEIVVPIANSAKGGD